MQDYGAVIPADEIPDYSEYDSSKNLLVSEDPPILVTHDLEHNYVPDIDYEAYEDETSGVVRQFFIQVVGDLDRSDKYRKDGVPLRVVLNHAVHHTGLSDDEAYEVLMDLSNAHGNPVSIGSNGRVTLD